jgi:Ca2+-binding EF-hand superfamily protein
MLPTYNERLGEKNVDQELSEAFRAFDKDGNGVISASELKNMMRSLGDKVTDEEIHNIMTEVDVNGDGVVSYEEFVMMMKPNSKKFNGGAEIKRKKEKNRKSVLNVKGWFHKLKREK